MCFPCNSRCSTPKRDSKFVRRRQSHVPSRLPGVPAHREGDFRHWPPPPVSLRGAERRIPPVRRRRHFCRLGRFSRRDEDDRRRRRPRGGCLLPTERGDRAPPRGPLLRGPREHLQHRTCGGNRQHSGPEDPRRRDVRIPLTWLRAGAPGADLRSSIIEQDAPPLLSPPARIRHTRSRVSRLSPQSVPDCHFERTSA